MIKPNELRLGNFIIDEDGKIGRVGMIAYNFTDFSKCKPVKITEDWLLKMGFKKSKLDGSYWFVKSTGKYNPVIVTNDIGECGFSNKLEFAFIDTFDLVKFKYVHQVQNIYFLLTGKEISVRLEK